MCRYGAQPWHAVLGRDPVADPLTEMELAMFEQALQHHLEAEFTPRENPDRPNASPEDL